ncbi:MAG: Cys-Gln thioester bond-forming surface protein [Candidatus Dormibacteria bacterium]
MNRNITSTDLRNRYRLGGSMPSGRRHLIALAVVAAMMIVVFVLPASADTQHTYDQARANAGYVYSPIQRVPGSFPGGEHFNYRAGLIQFTDDAGNPAGTGFCIDAHHERYYVPYTNGGRLDMAGGVSHPNQILWILNNVWPAGPSQLGNDQVGLAREGAAVQAAIWVYSDGAVLDVPGRPGVDAGVYSEAIRIVNAAREAGPLRSSSFRLSTPAPTYSLNEMATDRAVDVTATITGGDGAPAPDGTEVDFVTSAGLIGGQPVTAQAPFRSHSQGGKAVAHLSVPGAVPGEQVGVSASAVVPIRPGQVLNPSGASQRLIEFSWSTENVAGSTAFTFTAHAVPHVSKLVKDITPGHEAVGVDREIVAYTGDRLRYEISCGNSGLVPTAGGVITDDLAAVGNTSLGLLESIKAFQVVNGKETPATISGNLLSWNVGPIAPGGSCVVGFEGSVPKALDAAATTLTNCAYLNSTGGTTGGLVSNCVHTVVKTTASLVAVKLVDGTKANTATPGGVLTYTIEATNTGNRNLSAVTVSDDLSKGTLAGLTAIKPGNGGKFNEATRVVSWTIPALGAGEHKQVTFQATIPGETAFKCGTTVMFDNVAEVRQVEIPGGETPTGSVETTVAGSKCPPPPAPPAATIPPPPAPPTTQVLAAATSMPVTGADIRRSALVGGMLMLAGLVLLWPARRPSVV